MNDLICGLYTRVSTQQQLENDYNSIESQKERLREYCKYHDYEVYRVYEDKGLSAGNLERPDLRELIQDITCGNINCVIVYKIDRISRSMPDFYKLYELFEQHGVKFISVSENFDTNTSLGRLSLNMAMGFAQYEREMDGDRIRDKLEQRARKGMWHGGNAPYGYTGKDSKLIINPEETERLTFMFETYEANPSLSHLREELHLRGWYNRKGKPWPKTVLKNILCNQTYIGVIKHHDTVYPGIHEPIIPNELFERVQQLHPNRTHVKSKLTRTYLLRGLLTCSSCGTYMTPHYTRKTKKDGTKYNIPYYRCTTTAHHSVDMCEIKSVNADKLEDKVIQYLGKLSNDETILEKVAKELNRDHSKAITPLEKKRTILVNRIRDIRTEISNLVNSLAQGSITREYLEKGIAERNEKIEKLEQKRYLIESEINNYQNRPYELSALQESLLNFSTIFDHLTPKEKAEALQCMVQNIEVHSDHFALNLYELQNVFAGSQKRSFWWS